MNAKPIVDLTNLHSMTEGDKELEKEVFGEFITSFEEGMETLRFHCEEGDNESWRKCAHALKGVAINLGAQRLGDLCALAQEQCQMVTKGKVEMLRFIEEEYAKVKQFLSKAA